MMILFATPIFYPLDAMPHVLRIFAEINPFYIVAEAYRATLIAHHLPNLYGLFYEHTDDGKRHKYSMKHTKVLVKRLF